MKAIITVGISGSGKTTWAEEFTRNRNDWVNINRDDARFPDGDRDYYNYRFKRNKENKITETSNEMMKLAAQQEKNIIISDTNLNKGRRDSLVESLEVFGYEVELKFFEVTLVEAIKRDRQRYGGVGEEVILRQWIQLNGTPVKRGPHGELAYVVDIDGTVADNHNLNRGWYDWARVGEDLVHYHIMNMVKSLDKSGYTIIFLSGRDGVCEPETREWLNQHFGTDYELFMRAPGDDRRDSIIKEELFREHILDFYNVQAVIDDRPQVIKECWMKLGIPTICVGNPYDSK